MEFFDKLGKKASEAYKMTADKTGKIAKETKIKLKIGELRTQVNDVYEEIGKKVYEKHVLEGEISIENENIYIAGVEDLWKGSPDAEKALKDVKAEDFAVLLTHNPEYFEEMTEKGKNLSDIILAGHTHGGQVTLFGKIVASAIENKEKYGYGMKNYGGHKLYITSGVGGTAFEMFIRFFAKPEVVILKLKKI